MLDKITAPEVIPQTVEKSVRPYALEQQIPLDQLLLHYIKVSAAWPQGPSRWSLHGEEGHSEGHSEGPHCTSVSLLV
jgi:hypothetical protein